MHKNIEKGDSEMKGAMYIRVSTEDQIEYSPDAQKRALYDYAKKNDITILDEYIFIDEGISGRSAKKRPAFLHMIATAKSKPKPFDVILVHKFDRFARSREDSVVYKSLLRKECGIRVISITEQMEDDKFSVILEAMLEAMAEYYSLNLSDEVIKGMSERARKGQYQSGAPLGYDMINGKLEINPNTSEIVKKIFDMYLNQNISEFAIARYLNELGYRTKYGNLYEKRTIRYILQNPVYCGYIRWNSDKKKCSTASNSMENIILEKGVHEPIISEQLYLSAKEKIAHLYRPKNTRPVETQLHWLSGTLRCSECGSVLVLCGKNHSGFQCSHYLKGSCLISHYVSVKKIENAVIDAFQLIRTNQNIPYQIRSKQNNENTLTLLHTLLEKVIQKEKRVRDAYINGIDTLSDYRDNRELLLKERNKLSENIKQLENGPITKPITSDLVYNIFDILAAKEEDKIKSIALKSICEKIIYDKSNETIDIYLFYQ